MTTWDKCYLLFQEKIKSIDKTCDEIMTVFCKSDRPEEFNDWLEKNLSEFEKGFAWGMILGMNRQRKCTIVKKELEIIGDVGKSYS